MTWVDNKDFKHKRDIQNERNSMKPKTAKITIRARGYGKSITLNDSQTDLVLRAIENEMLLLKELRVNGENTGMEEHQTLDLIRNSIAEGPK